MLTLSHSLLRVRFSHQCNNGDVSEQLPALAQQTRRSTSQRPSTHWQARLRPTPRTNLPCSLRTRPRRRHRPPWPEWVHPKVQEAWENLGVPEPYLHQVQAADTAHHSAQNGGKNHVILATGTASGKSLAYLLPTLDAVHRGELNPGTGMNDERATVLYLPPPKLWRQISSTPCAR